MKQILIILLLAGLVTANQDNKGAQCMLNNLKNDFHLDDSSGNITDSINAKNLTKAGTATQITYGLNGVFNYTIKFNDTGTPATAPIFWRVAGTDFTNQTFTISQWVKYDSGGSHDAQSVAVGMNSGFTNGVTSYYNTNGAPYNAATFKWYIEGNAQKATTGYSMSKNTWNWVALSIYNTTGICTYTECMNKTCQSGTCSGVIYATGSNFTIGHATGSGSVFNAAWNGSIDETRYYDTNLSTSQLNDLFDCALQTLNTTTPTQNQIYTLSNIGMQTLFAAPDTGGFIINVSQYNGTWDTLATTPTAYNVVVTNSSSSKVRVINATHYLITTNYSSINAGAYTWNITGCSGQQLYQCQTNSYSFQVATGNGCLQNCWSEGNITITGALNAGEKFSIMTDNILSENVGGLNSECSLDNTIDRCHDVNGYSLAWTNMTNIKFTIFNNTNGFTGSADMNGVSYSGGNKMAVFTCGGSGCAANGTIINVCLPGADNVFNYPSVASAGVLYMIHYPWSTSVVNPHVIYPLTTYQRNFTFIDEATGTNFDLVNNQAILTTSCADYSQVIKNLQNGNNSFTMQFKQRPRFSVQVNSISPRVRNDIDERLVTNYVLTTSSNALPYTFRLLDYTGGQFFGSTLSVQKPIAKLPPQNIYVEPFDQANLAYPTLLNETSYKVVVSNPNSVRDLGNTFMRDNTVTKDVIVSTPDLSTGTKCATLNFTTTWDWGNSQVGCAWIDTASATNVSLTVYNYTGISRVLDYSSYQVAQSGSIVKTVGDQNGTYQLSCTLTNSECTKTIDVLIHMRNTTAYYSGWNANLPNTIMGLSRATVYKIIAIAVILITAAIFGAFNLGAGATVTTLVTSFFVYIGYLSIPAWFLGFLMTLSLVYWLSQNRSGVLG